MVIFVCVLFFFFQIEKNFNNKNRFLISYWMILKDKDFLIRLIINSAILLFIRTCILGKIVFFFSSCQSLLPLKLFFYCVKLYSCHISSHIFIRLLYLTSEFIKRTEKKKELFKKLFFQRFFSIIKLIM